MGVKRCSVSWLSALAITFGTVLVSCGSDGTERPRGGGAPDRWSPRPVTLAVSGDEYELLGNLAPLAGTLGTECPPSHGMASVPATCWSWEADGLGNGTYLQVFQAFTWDHISFTFTLARSADDSLTGTGVGHLESETATGPQDLGHERTLPHTMTVTGGTGRFAGITAELSGVFTSTVVAVDPDTGLVRKKVAGSFTGTLRRSRP